jgi:hypothetical protein
MKKLILLTFVLIAANVATAQNVFTKYVYSDTDYLLEERTPSGELVQTVDVSRTFKTWKSYYSNGQIQIIGYTRGNHRIGKWLYYTQTGSLELVLSFKDNALVKYEKRFIPPSNLIATR